MKAILLLVLLLIPVAEKEGARKYPVLGVAYLAIEKFTPEQCELALSVFRGVKRPGLSFVWRAFGDDLSCVEKFLLLPQESKVLEIHLTNETCVHSGRYCTKYDRANPERRARQIAAFLRKHKGEAEFFVTVGLEDDLSNSAFRTRVKILRRYLPKGTKLTRNPDAKTTYYNGVDAVELHGASPRYVGFRGRRIFSNDGFDLHVAGQPRPGCNYMDSRGMLSAIQAAAKGDYYTFAWFQAQGGCTARFIEPRKRSIRIDSYVVHEVNRLFRIVQKG